MDGSPYSPGAGHSPPVLAGRDVLLRDWRLMLGDVATAGRVRAQDMVLAGPRGVGKTVSLTAFGRLAQDQGFEVVNLQAVSGHAGLVEALLHRARVRIEEQAGPWQRAKDAFERIGGFTLSLGVIGAELKLTDQQQLSTAADAGGLARALATLASEIRQDVRHGGLLITVDELQVAGAADLALLAATLHRLNVDHPASVVVFAGTGLPFTPEALRKAGVTHPDRLFVLEQIPLTLTPEDARFAVVEPARRFGVAWEPAAASAVCEASNGYPAHLQMFAHAAWRAAPGPDLITLADARAAIADVGRQLEIRTLGPRWDRISDRQMEYLAALALLEGRAPSAAVAKTLGRSLQEISWLRKELIDEGDIYAPRRGQLAMAVPLFSRYVLAHYEQARLDASTPLLSLAEMRANRDR